MGDVLTRDVRVTLARSAAVDLRERLRRTRLAAVDGDGWERGVPRSWLAALLADWELFDTAAFQARLDRLPHQEADGDGQPAFSRDLLLSTLTLYWVTGTKVCRFGQDAGADG